MYKTIFIFLGLLLKVQGNFVLSGSKSSNIHSFITPIISPHQAECFYIPVEKNQILDIEYNVENVGLNANTLNVEISIYDQNSFPVGHTSINDYGSLKNHRILYDGNYSLCVSNVLSSYNAYIAIDVNIQAQIDVTQNLLEIEAVNEFNKQSNILKSGLGKVGTFVGQCHHKLFILNSMLSRDLNRGKALKDLIDKWNLALMSMVIVVSFIQITCLKKLFYVEVTHGMTFKA